MSTLFFDKNGVDWINLFEPETNGNGASDPIYKDANNVPLRFAALSHGSKIADMTYYRSDGVSDITTLWAGKGTVGAPTPSPTPSPSPGGGGLSSIDGGHYTAFYSIPAQQQGSASLFFKTDSATTWELYQAEGPHGAILASGTFSAGAAKIKYTMVNDPTQNSPSGQPGGYVNNATSPTNIVSGLSAQVLTGLHGDQSGTRESVWAITVQVYNAAGTQIDSATMQFDVGTDGSV